MQSPRSADIEARFLQTVALLGTLSTAAEVRHAIAQRRNGTDPSAQEEPAEALSYLADTEPELRELLIRLRLLLIQEESESRLVGLVRAFDQAMLVSRCRNLLYRIHQRLLSLYPAVSEVSVERARTLHAQLGTEENRSDAWHGAIDDALALCSEIQALN